MPVAQLAKEKMWSKMFPTVFKTEQQSLVFMKKLFAVAISNIVYIRSIFPEYAFFDKQLEGIKLKILREDSKCPGASKVINWVRGCFDALDRHYLKTVIIGFYSDAEDPDTVIESYSFKFTYGLDSVSIKLDNNKKSEPDLETVIKNDDAPEKIKKATLSLLRTMILAGNTQHPLPEKVIVTMNFRIILRTDKASFTENYVKNNVTSDKEQIVEPGINLVKETPNTNNNIRTKSTPNDSAENDEEYVVRCPCGGNKDDGIMIMCEYCKNWQHSVCFAITEEELVPEIHVCDACADANLILVPTDNKLKDMNSEERQELCLIRRAVVYCKTFEIIEPRQLSDILGVEINVGKGVFHALQKEGVLINLKRKTKNKGLSKQIDKNTLESLFKKFFVDAMNKENVGMQSTLKRKRSLEINNLSNSTDNMSLTGCKLDILNASQDSLNSGQCKKMRKGGIVKTPVVVATRN